MTEARYALCTITTKDLKEVEQRLLVRENSRLSDREIYFIGVNKILETLEIERGN